jgi:hypothetical protein
VFESREKVAAALPNTKQNRAKLEPTTATPHHQTNGQTHAAHHQRSETKEQNQGVNQHQAATKAPHSQTTEMLGDTSNEQERKKDKAATQAQTP